MLDANLKAQLKAYLERLHAAGRDRRLARRQRRRRTRCARCCEEIAALSDKISAAPRRHGRAQAVVPDQPRRRTTWACASPAIPMGHEFTSLVLALLQVGGHPPKVEADVIEQIARARRRLRVRDLHVAHLPQLPGRGAGAEPDGGAEPARAPRRDRRRPVPGRGRGAPDHGRADGVPQRRAVRLGPHGAGRDPGQDRHRRRRARRRASSPPRTPSTC